MVRCVSKNPSSAVDLFDMKMIRNPGPIFVGRMPVVEKMTTPGLEEVKRGISFVKRFVSDRFSSPLFQESGEGERKNWTGCMIWL